MNMTDRDRRILIVILSLGAIAAFYFLALKPKRDDASALGSQITQAEQQRDQARARANTAKAAQSSFAADYASVIRLGKAVPVPVDMASLLVQLDRAARGTNIDFRSIQVGQRAAATAPAPPPTQQQQGQAQSPAGQARDTAQGAVDQSNQASAQAEGAQPETQTSTTPSGGGLPVGGGTPAPAQPGTSVPASGLESVPLDFTFNGTYFDLADLLHRFKRFVRVVNDRIVVRGRLIVIDSFTFTSGEDFPEIVANVKATVYLSPRDEGVSAGATPVGPSTTQPAGTQPPAAGTTTTSTPAP